jgi:altronate dehydratase
MKYALQIHSQDNTGVVTQTVKAGETVQITGTDTILTAKEDIPPGHKIALCNLAKGEVVTKYGIPIGEAKEPIERGYWVHCHNVNDITEQLCNKYCDDYLRGGRTIQAYPRKDGTFGVANYIMIFATSLDANQYAEALAEQTGVFWMVCDKYQLTDHGLSDFTKLVIEKTAQNPNIYGAVILDTEENRYPELLSKIRETGKNAAYAVIKDDFDRTSKKELLGQIETWQQEIKELRREPVPIEGLKISVHCAGSDWTTALSGNPVLGIAADYIVKNGGYVFMDEWAGFPGSEHLLASHAASGKIGREIIEKVRDTRRDYIKKTGKTVEETNPYPSNKEGGITTLVEKSTGNIKKAGSSVIQGILKPAQKPDLPGVYLLDQPCGAPASTAAYGALSGCHINVLVSGVGFIYEEIPHLLDIRITGNPETFRQEQYRLDFNAGTALEGNSIEKTGKELYEYIISVAEGHVIPKNETMKCKAFTMFYPDDRYVGEEYIRVETFREKHKEKVDAIKQ